MTKDVLKQLIINKQSEIPFSIITREDALPIVSRSIITVPGVRRCGKSTKMCLVMNELFANGTSPENILWVSFDDERMMDMQAKDLDMVLESYRELFPHTDLQNVYMFFDEIQLIDGWELFIIRVFKNYCKHIFISGSNAKLLSQEIATTLRGWAVEYLTYPLSFAEYCNFTNVKHEHLTEAETVRLRLAWDDFNFGSAFPEVVLSNDFPYRERLLQGYYNAMLFRDLVERHNIRNIGALRYFIKRLMNNLTKPTSIHAIYNDIRSQGTKVSKDDLYLWSDYVCECFMFFRIPRYTNSLIEEQHSFQKYYFIDNGLRQAVLLPQSNDNGKLLENSVFLHLIRHSGMFDKISYFQGNRECDFIVQHENGVKCVLQVSWSLNDPKTRQREMTGLLEAANVTKCENLIIITHDEEDIIQMNNKVIHIIPAWKWMLTNWQKK